MSGIVYGCVVPHPPIIVPDIGKGRESEISATADSIKQVAERLAASHPDVILVISPHGTAHYQAMGIASSNMMRGDLRTWGADNLNFRFNNDKDMADALQREAQSANIPLRSLGDRGYNLDHGITVPFYFLRRKLNDVPVIPLTFCWLPLDVHYDFGKVIARAARRANKRVAIVASGDMSHRLIPDAPAGYDPMGEVFDKQVQDATAAFDAQSLLNMDQDLIDKAGECGLRSIIILMGALSELDVKPEVLSYEGPFGVGYMVASLEVADQPQQPQAQPEAEQDQLPEQDKAPEQKPDIDMHPLVRLAKDTVESFTRNGSAPNPQELTPEMQEKAGIFVSIKKNGELRGCIGTFEPTKPNIALEIVSSAIGAATRDPRFTPIAASELADLEYSVDVLSGPEPAKTLDNLDPEKYGVIVEGRGHRGLLLPNLDGVDSVQEQLDIARYKAGLEPNEEIMIQRFEVKRYK
mgnify:CR=1 FL=1